MDINYKFIDVNAIYLLISLLQIAVYWSGWDEESLISDYVIGFSSSRNNEIPDLVTHSTQGHGHYIMYHPELTQGMVVFLIITATNKAQLSTRKVNHQFFC